MLIYPDLYAQILINVLCKQDIKVTFTNLELSATEIVNLVSYQALKKIKTIIDDDSLEDDECFMRIEEVICTLEDMGSDGGFRHDFG